MAELFRQAYEDRDRRRAVKADRNSRQVPALPASQLHTLACVVVHAMPHGVAMDAARINVRVNAVSLHRISWAG